MPEDVSVTDSAINVKDPYYEPHLNDFFRDEDRQFFESYTGLTGHELHDHLNRTRDWAYKMGEYPCVGQWGFLKNRYPQIVDVNGGDYQTFIERIRTGATILDVGCCFGQDLRRLAAESGAPTEGWYATDLNDELWEMGYDMFRDKDRMKAKFLAGDLLDDRNPLWKLGKNFDVILLSQILHLFGWEQNVSILKGLVPLSRRGCQLLGFQSSRVNAHEHKTKWGTMFSHDADSFRKLWKEVERETGTSWAVKVRQVPYHDIDMPQGFIDTIGPTGRALLFVVTREQ